MNKKMIGIIIAVIVLIGVAIGGFILLRNNDTEKEQDTNNPNSSVTTDDKTENNEATDNEENNDNTTNNSKKVLVVYFSATNNTKSVAEAVAQNLNGDTFEIVPKDVYTSEDLNYGNPDSRVSKEHDDETLRNVELKTTKVDNWDSYDTILIGYPIWWGVAAWPVDTFVKANDFSGKTVIPFCTSASSGLGGSGLAGTVSTIKNKLTESYVESRGFTISRNDMVKAPEEIKSWLKEIDMIDYT